MVNATGWNYLVNGSLIKAPLVLWDSYFSGWTIFILFVVYQIMLWRKTEGTTLPLVTGLFFAFAYSTSTYVFDGMNGLYSHSWALGIIYTYLVFMLMGTIFGWLKK